MSHFNSAAAGDKTNENCTNQTHDKHPAFAKPIDVLILGAGIAGLAAAAALQAEGFSVLVLESRDRIGGRIHSVALGSSIIDLGASWIHGNSSGNSIAGIAVAEGLQLIATDARDNLLHTEAGIPVECTVQAQYEVLYGKFEEYLAQQQEDLSTSLFMSVQHVRNAFTAKHNLSQEDQQGLDFMINTRIEQEYGADAADLSAKWFDADEPCDGDDMLFLQGYCQIVEAVARELRDNILLQHTVTRVRYNPAGNTPHHSSSSSCTDPQINSQGCCCSCSCCSASCGCNKVQVEALTIGSTAVFQAPHVVVTFPLGVLKAHADELFDPPLPADKLAAIRSLGVGLLDKVVLLYDTPFWLSQTDSTWLNRLPGHAKQTPGHGSWQEFFNAAKFLPELPALVAFNCGTPAWQAELLTDEQLTRQVTDVVARMYPGSAALAESPKHVIVTRWGLDPYALGSYAMMAVGSSPDDLAALAAPVGNVLFFAGEAMSALNQGTVHGAFCTGRTAARAIIALRRQQKAPQQQQLQQ